jgi:hypothetical protein
MHDAGGLGREPMMGFRPVYHPALLEHYLTLPARYLDLDDGGLEAAVAAGTGVADKSAEEEKWG